ncbi:MAG: tetratricopeptide repeat protein [Anaerolineales bacterium]|nr:tetratricopeptide repeat protein [Anaerolineales bacterium]
MAKVSLRIYNREIERLVEQGHIDEAIAHCRHILKTFPKHLETYRMLGKAFLESKRYGEAVDVFGRVLMATPGDFVSHVGLSIINDEQNKMDDAIWHMERAFEAQPSNAAIQGELQRLYGRRDGMEPPKIRMTRGALAHMYVQGELYPQAIAEIRAVLAQDSQRADMQILLAYSYFKGGQKSDASDICNQLLKRYPYCFDANRIMVELLPATAGATESTQIYRMHVGELDPYANFVKGSVFQAGDVPDASVNLERLEYSGEDVPAGQEWTSSLGLGSSAMPALGASSFDAQPDWLKSGGLTDAAGTLQTPPQTDSVSEPDGQIPDFLRAAGWGESNSPEQPISFFDDEPAGGGDALVPAELPDWLKGQAPAANNPPPQPDNAMMQATDTPDWLSGLDNAQSSSSSFETPQADAEPSGDTPDWLSGLGAATTAAAASAAAASQAHSTPSNDVPDWLSGLDSAEKPADPVSASDWLSGAAEEPAAQPADLPDWLQAAEPKSEPAPSVESLGASAQEQDDAVAWLESLAAKHGAKPEELVTDPNKRSETPPDWVSQAQTINQQPAAQQPNVESLGASSQEQDDAVAWLESLAAKHGAKPEELVTDPNKRSETPPEWVSQAQTINQQPAAQQSNVQDLGASAQEQDDAVAWLESLAAKHGAKPEELVTDPNKRSETPPDWVQQAQSIGEAQSAEKPEWSEGAQNIGEQFFAEFENASGAAPATDETGMWLRDLDGKEKQDEQPLERGTTSPNG